MSRNARILVVVGTLVVLAIAFVVLRPSDDADDTATTTTQTTPTTTTTTAVKPPPPPPPKYTTVVVRDGKPVGGVQKIKVKKGKQARIAVSSPDTSDEIHLHGYDLKRELEAGGEVRFSFVAKSDGIYEIELEDAGVQIAELVVEP